MNGPAGRGNGSPGELWERWREIREVIRCWEKNGEFRLDTEIPPVFGHWGLGDKIFRFPMGGADPAAPTRL